MDEENSTSDVPDWINTDFLKKILCPHEKEDTIKSWKIEKGTAPGDNYTSIIYRVSVDLICREKIESKSLIIKVELTNKEVTQIASEGNAFGKEIHVYSTIIPEMYKMLKEMSQNKFQPFAPYCYYTHLGPPGSVLVFEDLKNESFKLAERTVGLDMRHSLLVVRSLAVYHASSVILFEKQPELFEPLMSSVYQKNSSDSLKSLFSPILRDLAEELEKWPGYKERFSEKLHNIADKSVDFILDGVARDEGDFNVLVHEDPWLNNIMFRYSEDTGEVVDIRLVDFQSCHWLAPATDIQRYLFSTAAVEVIEQHDFILEEYFKVLRDTLDALGYVHLCPTIDHLKRQMDRRAMFGIVLGIVTRAFFLADPEYMVMDSAPLWLNNEFLEKALNSKEENDVKVVSSEITKATAPGDNYGSEMYRAVVQILKNGVQEKKSLIVKSELTNIEMKKVTSEGNLFEKEINAYNLAISNLDRILTDCALNKYQPYAAKCYYTHIGEPASVLVLEDLKESGFRLANPSRGLDLKHCFIAVNTLAVYHATSAVLNAKYPEKIEPFKTSLYCENMRANMEKMFKPVLKQLALEAENWPECKGVIAKKLRDIESMLFDHLLACVKTDDDTFNVLCHEDCWLNNIMFRYSEETNKVTDVRFVDFQACHWTSPAIDLLYFINAAAAAPILKRPHIIIDEYYRTLCETLNTLGYGHLCPSKNDICNQFEKRHKFGVIIGCILRYVMFINRNDVPDMEKILKNEVQLTFSETYRNDMREILPAFHQRGWL